MPDKSAAFNTARLEALELDNLLEVAEATAITAEGQKRKSPRSPRAGRLSARDENWLCHSMYFPEDKRVGKRDVNFAPRTMEAFEPKEGSSPLHRFLTSLLKFRCIVMQVSVYRYNPDLDEVPVMRDVQVDLPEGKDLMVLDVLHLMKDEDPTLSFRRSCREGACGSDGINMNGKNGLACITPVSEGDQAQQTGAAPVTRPACCA